jgi:hypothetical protein
MPHYPVHPLFLFGLTSTARLWVRPAEVPRRIVAGRGYAHRRAVAFFVRWKAARRNRTDAANTGVQEHAVEHVAPILRRATDVARLTGVDALAADFEITPEHLEACGVKPPAGGIALIRTGWAKFWNDPKQFIFGGSGVVVRGPGPTVPGAQWLSSRGIFAAGSDTVSFERVPSNMEVHVHLLVEKGIHIIAA